MLKPTLRTLALFAGATFVATAFAAPLRAADKLAIKAGRIITQAGPEITDGVILVVDGRIEAVGADVEVPWDAEVIDAEHLVAFPGFVDAHATRGVDSSNENIDVAPFLDVRDSMDPVNFFFEDSLRSGITTINVQQGNRTVIGGHGLVVKPHGMTIGEMTVHDNAGIKISARPKPGKSRATQAQALRKAFGDLQRYLEGLVEKKKDGDDQARREALYQGRDLESEENKTGRALNSTAVWTVEGLEAIPRGEIDEKQAPLVQLVEGRLPAFIHCQKAMDVHLALEVASDNGFLHRTTLVLESGCWKAADVIAERGVPVVLLPSLVHVENDPVTGEEIETFVPAVYEEAGVRYAFSGSNGPLWYQAAFAVGRGLDREAALRAVTTTPAEILQLGDRVGSLAPGSDGNVVLFSGDPLSIKSFVEYVVLEGELVFDRSKDVRSMHIYEGTQPEQTAPPEPDVEEPEDEGAEDSDAEAEEEAGDDEKDEEGDEN